LYPCVYVNEIDDGRAGYSRGVSSDPTLVVPIRVQLRGTQRQDLSGLTGSIHSFNQVDGSMCMQLDSGLCLPAPQIGQMHVREEISALQQPDTDRQPALLLRPSHATGCVRGNTHQKTTEDTRTSNQDPHTPH
jgi:hypothetical protein